MDDKAIEEQALSAINENKVADNGNASDFGNQELILNRDSTFEIFQQITDVLNNSRNVLQLINLLLPLIHNFSEKQYDNKFISTNCLEPLKQLLAMIDNTAGREYQCIYVADLFTNLTFQHSYYHLLMNKYSKTEICFTLLNPANRWDIIYSIAPLFYNLLSFQDEKPICPKSYLYLLTNYLVSNAMNPLSNVYSLIIMQFFRNIVFDESDKELKVVSKKLSDMILNDAPFSQNLLFAIYYFFAKNPQRNYNNFINNHLLLMLNHVLHTNRDITVTSIILNLLSLLSKPDRNEKVEAWFNTFDFALAKEMLEANDPEITPRCITFLFNYFGYSKIKDVDAMKTLDLPNTILPLLEQGSLNTKIEIAFLFSKICCKYRGSIFATWMIEPLVQNFVDILEITSQKLEIEYLLKCLNHFCNSENSVVIDMFRCCGADNILEDILDKEIFLGSNESRARIQTILDLMNPPE